MGLSFTLLDGGMGRELEKIGAPFAQPEWSALSLIEDPASVTTAHQNFIDAGADIITTNAYAVVPFHIGEERFNDIGRGLIGDAARLAREAADGTQRPVKVAGCIPPVFGSYRPDLFDAAAAPQILAPLVEEQEQYVDLWLAETLSCIDEARCALDALSGSDKPKWVAYTLADQHGQTDPISYIRSGEPLSEAVKIAADNSAEAVLVNCCYPEDVARALDNIHDTVDTEKLDIQYGAYANAFEHIKKTRQANRDISATRIGLTPEIYAAYIKDWYERGARIIGGCCGIGSHHIKHIHEVLRS